MQNNGGVPARHSISYLDVGIQKLRALSSALNLSERRSSDAVELFEFATEPWGGWSIHQEPGWRNDITDDATPFEFSVAFPGNSGSVDQVGGPELRLLFESQRRPLSDHSSWEAGLAFNERLRKLGRTDLSRFDRVRDLFTPRGRAGVRFSLWHAVVLQNDGTQLFKAYLNPGVDGAEKAAFRVAEALARLELPQAWNFIGRRFEAAQVTPAIPYFSVDLEGAESGRAKIYVSARSAREVEALVQGSANMTASDARTWLQALAGAPGPYDARPMLVCFNFRRRCAEPDVTLHVPIRCYADGDAAALERVTPFLSESDAHKLRDCVEALAGGPVGRSRGVLTYASLRPSAKALRLTAYLSPQIYAGVSGLDGNSNRDSAAGPRK